MRLQLMAVLALLLVIAAAEADANESRAVCEPYNDDLPVTRIEVGKSFSGFTLPNGEFRVFYAVLGKESALDLIRVHCVVDVPKDIREDSSFIQVTFSNGRSSTTFSLPKLLSNGTLFYEDAHTIAPLEVDDFEDHHEQVIMATLISRAIATVTGKIRFANYDRSQYNVILPPSSPKVKVLLNQRAGYVRPLSYRLAANGSGGVRVLIESEDDICAKLAISGNKNVWGESWSNEVLQTMEFTRRLDLVLFRDNFRNVMLMHIEIYPDDTRCSPGSPGRKPNKLKVFNITWSGVEDIQLLKPISVSISCFLLPMVCALAYASVSRRRNFDNLNDVGIDQTLRRHSIDDVDFESDSNSLHTQNIEQQNEYGTLSSLSNAGERTLVSTGVSTDLQQQEWSWTSAQFALVLLPVLSLVISSPNLGMKWKDDQCFHNYACAEPLWIFPSFNHVFSNVGYAVSGVFFLTFATMRKKKPTLGCGAYANYGIELSMGLSLLCEALASSIYHICPNSITYNLDTPFIEITCVLLMLKVYGSRRRVITPQYANIAVTFVITLDSVITMFAEKSAVRGIATALIIIALLFSVSVLLFGPGFSLSFLKANSERKVCVILAIGTFAANIIEMVVCNMTSYRIETTQFVTVCCIINALFYLLYYIVMKHRKKEKWCNFSRRSVIAAILLWAAALFLFLKEETDWKLTPAQSRAVNRPCVLLNFFDYHDLWHMTSALASLLLLVGVSTLDDDLCAIPTRELPVF